MMISNQTANPLHLVKYLMFGYLLIASMLFCNTHAIANEYMDLTVTGGYEDNLPRGFLDKDIHNSNFLKTSLNKGKLYQPRVNASISFSGNVICNDYFNLAGFNRLGLGVGFNIQQKLGMGAYSTKLNFGAASDLENSKGSERDRSIYSFNVSAFK